MNAQVCVIDGPRGCCQRPNKLTVIRLRWIVSWRIADSGNNRVRKLAGGTIATVAGNGAAKFAGDGGPATTASLRRPQGVAVDSEGNLYVADGKGIGIDWTSANLNGPWFGGSRWVPNSDACHGKGWRALIIAALSRASTPAC